jgi:hypothetical protein
MRLYVHHGWLALTMLAMTAFAHSREQADHLRVGNPLPRFELIQPAVHRYLRYAVKEERRTAVDVWSRKISFEDHEGRRLLHIVQRWDEASDEAPYFLVQDSWFEPGTFRALTHVRTRERAGKVEIVGYRFLPDRIVGIADLPDNVRKDFSVAAPEESYNFQYDMELLQTLLLRNGYSVSIPFYDAGFEPPGRYIFVVAGSGTVRADGRPIDCWIVTADYNTGSVVSRFWFDKRTQLMIREEQRQADGSILIKTLLNPELADG